MDNSRINIIKEKIRKYKLIFGLSKHTKGKEKEYNWSPKPISISEIRSVEKYHNINLPNEYKLFLTKIGNGGLGPTYYPLYSLKESIQYSETPYFKNKFPLEKLWLRCGTQKTWESQGYTDSYEETQKSCINDLIFAEMLNEKDCVKNCIYDLPEKCIETDGTLLIGESGCGLDFHLVLNGKFRGEIWHSRVGGMGSYSSNYLSFIEEWLDYYLEDNAKQH